MTSGEVAILDRVTLRADDAMPWLDRLRREYGPAAEQRRMQLAGTWWCHSRTAGAIDVHVLWVLATLADFWAMRRAAGADASVKAWWTATDTLALDRDRQVLARAEAAT